MTRKQPAEQQKNRAVTTKQLRELHEQGLGRNAIARRLNTTHYQVDKAAKKAGITFDRSAILDATEARNADALIDRVDLAEKFRHVAHVCLDKVLEGGNEPATVRELLTAAGIAATNDVRLGGLIRDSLPKDSTIGQEAVTEALRAEFGTLLSSDIE